MIFWYTPSGTAGTNDYVDFANIQLEQGSVATQFSRLGGTLQGELAACQRYYWRQTALQAYATFGNGHAPYTDHALITIPYKVTMRTIPTVLDYSSLAIADGYNAGLSISSATIAGSGTSSDTILISVNCSGATQYRPYYLIANNTTSAYFGFGAEL